MDTLKAHSYSAVTVAISVRPEKITTPMLHPLIVTIFMQGEVSHTSPVIYHEVGTQTRADEEGELNPKDNQNPLEDLD